MAYSPVYTSVERVSELCQFTIDDSSTPNYDTVLDYIENAEKRIEERKLGSHTATNVYVDVPTSADITSRYDWVFNARTGKVKIDMGRGKVIPLVNVKTPVISITSLYKNDESEDDAPDWEQLTQWDGSTGSTDFMLLSGGDRDLGYALWIYDDYPEEGPKRLRMTYTYGYNVPTAILREYCTYDAAVQTLINRMGSNQPSGLGALEGDSLGSFIPRQYSERITEYRYEMLRIEANYFPRQRDRGGVVL